jgi:hypothetical protein
MPHLLPPSDQARARQTEQQETPAGGGSGGLGWRRARIRGGGIKRRGWGTRISAYRGRTGAVASHRRRTRSAGGGARRRRRSGGLQATGFGGGCAAWLGETPGGVDFAPSLSRRRDGAAELGSHGGGGALRRAARRAGEEGGRVGFMGVEHRRPSRARLGRRGVAPAGCPRSPASPGLARGGGSARWACAAGLRPGLEWARAGQGRNKSWAEEAGRLGRGQLLGCAGR